jgi:hypothetical protein
MRLIAMILVPLLKGALVGLGIMYILYFLLVFLF